MLTAIRDFAQDAFGRGREGQLEEIEYGDESILLEASRHAYLAIVTGGVEPPGFRAEMRRCIVEIEHAHGETLRSYDGDASALASSEASLRPLTREIEPPRLSCWSLGLGGSAEHSNPAAGRHRVNRDVHAHPLANLHPHANPDPYDDSVRYVDIYADRHAHVYLYICTYDHAHLHTCTHDHTDTCFSNGPDDRQCVATPGTKSRCAPPGHSR
jgi:hypothetical protein